MAKQGYGRDDDRDLVEAWIDEHHAYNFEGESGLRKLEELCETIGYRESGFKYGDPIESFLCDNPGACQALVEFISEYARGNEEWREGLESSLQSPEDDEDEEFADPDVECRAAE